MKANNFEIIFILALSIFGGLVISLLFSLNLFSTIGATLVLLALLGTFYLIVIHFLGGGEEDPESTKLEVSKDVKSKYVALGVSTVQNTFTKPQIKEKVEQKQYPVIESKNPMEIFKDDPIGELEKSRDLILSLLSQTQKSYKKIEQIFGERMHKNTKTDIQNFLYLKLLNESLNRRLEQIIDVIDEAEKNQKLSLKKGYELVNSPLTIVRDNMNAVRTEQEIPPVPREEWEKTVVSVLKKLSRKKTFHQALNYAFYN